MDELLTPVSTAYRSSNAAPKEDALTEVPKPGKVRSRLDFQASTPEEALEILRNEPDFESLCSTLQYLVHDAPIKSAFKITSPSPLGAQIVNVLVSEVVPNYWSIFNEKTKPNSTILEHGVGRKLLISCLRHITGLNAILTRLKTLIHQAKEAGKHAGSLGAVESLTIYLNVLTILLKGNATLEHLWNNLNIESPPKQKALWAELLVIIGRGKLLNGASEAVHIVNLDSENIKESVWIGDGMLYSRWLAINIREWAKRTPKVPRGSWKTISEMLSKSLRLGYPDIVLEEILEMCFGIVEERSQLTALLAQLPTYEQRLVINGGLRLLSKRFLLGNASTDEAEWWKADETIVSGAAKYLECLLSNEESRMEHIITWLTSVSGAGIGEAIGIRRAAITVLSGSKNHLETVLEKSLQQFGDQLYIRHAPSLQQEVHAQVLLLTAGYVHRIAPLKIALMLRSGDYLNAVSNRLSSSSNRTRFLGMLVGETLSGLVEKGDKQMNFKMEELNSTEGMWYKSLVKVQDTIGSLDSLRIGSLRKTSFKAKSYKPIEPRKPVIGQAMSKIISIQELDDNEVSSEDEDLVPYAKPDSDEEDEDEDPTLVQRDKPTAPVYIRDLITYLRDIENFDRQKIALSTASSLIRRKSNFGTEVTAHAEELATLLVGLQDKYDLEDFQDMRVQGMIAVLLSQPTAMAKWFAKTFFDGDYSLSQRVAILTVLGISARELGGFKNQDSTLTKVKAPPPGSFPSKQLPSRLHTLYSASQTQPESQIDALSHQLSQTMIQPLAASLADSATGPNILKVRTFSSRLAVESRRAPATSNKLSAIVADAFFFPLTGRFFAHLKAYGPKNVIFEPFLLSSFIKTLSLILHASGTSTLQLPQMTSEMWYLLLSLRMQAGADHSVGEAVLFGFMTILEINEDKRRLSEVHSRELLETQRWVELFYDGKDDKVKALAAGVLYRIREVVEKYQALLMGDLSNF